MEFKRVVITGMGCVTPIGADIDGFWNSLQNGICGIGPITRFDASEHSSKIAAEVKDFNPEDYMDRRDARHTDRFAQLSVAASKMAIEDSKIDINESNADRIGVLIGSGIGGCDTWSDQQITLYTKGPRRVSPYFVPMLISDMAAGMVSIIYGAKGPNLAITTACASGTHSIGEAFRIIQRGEADAMIAGGAEAVINSLAMAGFCSAKALSTRNDDPLRSSRPFDLNRDGFVMGEGAGTIVMESLEFALARGAKIYGEIVGFGMTGDAFHITQPAPGGEGAARSMAMALKGADITPDMVNYINAHGTSTEANDKLETAAIKKVFGDNAQKVAISSTKSMTGHLLGAGGAVEAIACLLAIRDSIAPPTINYETPDSECDLDYVPNTARKMNIDIAMSNSFGFGGHNATLIFKKYSS